MHLHFAHQIRNKSSLNGHTKDWSENAKISKLGQQILDAKAAEGAMNRYTDNQQILRLSKKFGMVFCGSRKICNPYD